MNFWSVFDFFLQDALVVQGPLGVRLQAEREGGGP